ncbi:MAG TPA: histidinol-phosphate transaminase [Clostridiaceae bacterium]|nr:histidinol-phosphate transaminase [Clostridiaceae bacterium]
MSIYWSNVVKNINPYIPGEQPKDRKYIKLNTNENPYPPSERVIQAMKDAANSDIRLYPDPECYELREVIASYFNLNIENVYAGNGSDELLAFSFLAFFNPDRPILFPDVTYTFYPVYADLFNIKYETVRLDEEFSIPVELFFRENGGIIFPNPNAPTGKDISIESIKKILDYNKNVVVIIDEAYVDFGAESTVELIKNYPNLLIIRTFSKSHSLAGLRIGFALGNEELIQGLSRIKNSINSYTIDRIAMAGAMEAIKDYEYFKSTSRKIINTRERIIVKLKELGFNVVDSKANFVFISHPVIPAVDIFNKLKERGILVRYFNKPRIDNYLRVTIGTDEQMDCFLEEVKNITVI